MDIANKLFTEFPRPWRIVCDESVDPNRYAGAFVIYDFLGFVIFNGGTYTGDGDTEINLTWEQAKELVSIVNAAG